MKYSNLIVCLRMHITNSDRKSLLSGWHLSCGLRKILSTRRVWEPAAFVVLIIGEGTDV